MNSSRLLKPWRAHITVKSWLIAPGRTTSDHGTRAPPQDAVAFARGDDDEMRVPGPRFNVEMEVVLPPNMTVRESHDIALALQHKIEKLEDVERAFVHVDHELRDGLEHKPERELVTTSLLHHRAQNPISDGA